jgi:hypothetical protein
VLPILILAINNSCKPVSLVPLQPWLLLILLVVLNMLHMKTKNPIKLWKPLCINLNHMCLFVNNLMSFLVLEYSLRDSLLVLPLWFKEFWFCSLLRIVIDYLQVRLFIVLEPLVALLYHKTLLLVIKDVNLLPT